MNRRDDNCVDDRKKLEMQLEGRRKRGRRKQGRPKRSLDVMKEEMQEVGASEDEVFAGRVWIISCGDL